MQFFWGADTKNYQSPDLLDFPLFTLFGQEFSAYRGFMITISVGIFLVLYYVLTRSRIGIIIQAAITHPHTVAIWDTMFPDFYGGFRRWHCPGRGCRRHCRTGVDDFPRHGCGPGQHCVVIVVIGGLGSLGGAFVASLMIGLLQSYAIASNLGCLTC